MAVIELVNYQVAATDGTSRLAPFDFSLDAGDVCAVQTVDADLGHQFLGAVAMMNPPDGGEYRCGGRPLSRRRYTEWLAGRRNVGYIGPTSALISNLSIRENLLLSRYYYENDLRVDLPPDVLQLCHLVGLASKLSVRPSALNLLDRRIAIAIRELSRDLTVLVLDNPEDLMGHPTFHLLMDRLRGLHRQGVPMLMMSDGENPVRRMITRTVTIIGGQLREESSSLADQIEALR